MQRLISLKLASNLPKTISSSTKSSSLFHFQPLKTFSFTKPPQTQTQNHFFNSFSTNPILHQAHSWSLQHNLAQRIHGLLSNPLLRRHFLLDSANALLRFSSKKLLDYRLAFLQKKAPKLHFIPNSNSHHNARRSWFGGLSSSGIVWGLITANVAVFCLWKVTDPIFMIKHYTLSLYVVRIGQLHTLITSAFSHKDVGHIFSNMIGLYVFGMNIGRDFRPGFLLKLYLAGAIGGSVLFLVHNAYLLVKIPSKEQKSITKKHPYITTTLGASGALTATVLLDILLHPTAILYFIIPVPTVVLGILILGQDFLRVQAGCGYISGFVHLGGATVAAIVWARLLMRRRRLV